MFTIWLIGIVILGMYAAYQLGKVDGSTLDDILWITITGVLLWPLVLAVAIFIAPFVGMAVLGRRVNMKKKEEKDA